MELTQSPFIFVKHRIVCDHRVNLSKALQCHVILTLIHCHFVIGREELILWAQKSFAHDVYIHVSLENPIEEPLLKVVEAQVFSSSSCDPLVNGN